MWDRMFFFFSSRRRHTRLTCDWSSDVCSSDLDGTPMPTRYWLVGEPERSQVSALESAGGVRDAEAAVAAPSIADAHARYARERDAAIPADHDGPRPFGGVGGTR